jgi:hypothetical protein
MHCGSGFAEAARTNPRQTALDAIGKKDCWRLAERPLQHFTQHFLLLRFQFFSTRS